VSRLKALAATVVWFGLGLALFLLAGVGGWQGGWLLGLVWFAVAGGLLSWRMLGEEPGRGLFVTAVVVLGVTAALSCADRAPASAGRLARQMDGFHLDFYKKTGETKSGHGWCRPKCPTVERTWLGPYNNTRIGQVHAAVALHDAGYLPDIALKLSTRQTGSVRGGNDRVEAVARIRQNSEGRIVLTVRLSSKG
jgi:hypothetical protein